MSWTVVDAGPRWIRETRTWDYTDIILASGVTKGEADRMIEKGCGRVTAYPDSE